MNYLYRRRSRILPVLFFSVALAILMVMAVERIPANSNLRQYNNVLSNNSIVSDNKIQNAEHKTYSDVCIDYCKVLINRIIILSNKSFEYSNNVLLKHELIVL